ncbi:heme-binding protein 2-like isoform X1 [Hyla sarda]|uniref:heme-binding protein 2-like isoform X1 n=1 Tax=Hyla sarda TaxID=327740 RepID=UPI0024C46E8C|nr:heme-binding protein 2-like isoform X1 [Hyla sarda]
MEGRSALLLGLLSALWIAVAMQDSDIPSQLSQFCGMSDCPKYQLLKQYDNFQHRQYEETRWVTTALEQDVMGTETARSFRRLLNYIQGANTEGKSINMTLPVVMYIPLKEPPTVNSKMSFFVPHEVENPPTPTDPEVYLETLSAFSAYVKDETWVEEVMGRFVKGRGRTDVDQMRLRLAFGGYAINNIYANKARKLAEKLRALGLQFDDTYYVRAGYNDLFALFNRHGEVWYMAK